MNSFEIIKKQNALKKKAKIQNVSKGYRRKVRQLAYFLGFCNRKFKTVVTNY